MSRIVKAALSGAVLLLLTGCFGDGTWIIGTGEGEMPPGIYTAEAGPACHWARYQGGTPGFVTAENWAVNRMFVEVLPVDNRFLSESCGTWVEPQAEPYTALPDLLVESNQDHRVGIDMMPGTWRSTGTGDCLWIRVSDWQWDYGGGGLIAKGRTTGEVTVTVEPTDVGFESFGCGGWQKVA